MEQHYSYIYDGMNAFEKEVKRWIDFFFAGICLIVFSPLFLACYIAIKRNAESKGPQLCSEHRDKRLTKTGKFLREHHLDELPQLWNIFIGDMAFIGPRPERKFYIDQIIQHDPRYTYLYQIRPGITSMATLYNGYTDTMEKMLKRLEMDLDYLKHRSWWLDGKILCLTFLKIAFGKKF